MLTVPQAALRARRDPETIRRWIRAGKLIAWKVGTQYMIDEDDLGDAARGMFSTPPSGQDPQETLQVRKVLAALHQGRAERVQQIHEAIAPYLTERSDRPASTIDPWLSTIIGRIVRLMDPMRIVLFGSRARGDAREDSDYDLLVILDHVDDRRATKMAARRSFEDLPIGSDILVATIDEIEGRVPGRPMGAAYWALREGRNVYQRGDGA